MATAVTSRSVQVTMEPRCRHTALSFLSNISLDDQLIFFNDCDDQGEPSDGAIILFMDPDLTSRSASSMLASGYPTHYWSTPTAAAEQFGYCVAISL